MMEMEEEFFGGIDGNLVYNLTVDIDPGEECPSRVVTQKLYCDIGNDMIFEELTPLDSTYGFKPITKMTPESIVSCFPSTSPALSTTNEIIESALNIPFASPDELEDETTILLSILDVEEFPRTSEVEELLSISEVEESPRTLEVEEVPGTSEIEEPPRTLEVKEVTGTSEIEEPPRRKRGRRPKSETGPYTPAPRRRKPKKRKIYEIDQPFDDEVQEKKRLNAINAKKHRDEQKKDKQTLEQQLEEVKKERDGLQKEVEMLREREVEFKKQLEYFKKQALNLLSGLDGKSLTL